MYYFYNYLLVSLFACVLAGYCKYYELDLPEKKSEDVSNLDPVIVFK